MSARHVVAEVDAVPERSILRVEAGGRALCLMRMGGEFFALADRCPHSGAALSAGRFTGTVESDGPGHYRMCRMGEMLKCPWHGWEFDIRTGQSWSDPKSTRTRAFQPETVEGRELVKGPYVAETIPVSVEGKYVVVEIG